MCLDQSARTLRTGAIPHFSGRVSPTLKWQLIYLVSTIMLTQKRSSIDVIRLGAAPH